MKFNSFLLPLCTLCIITSMLLSCSQGTPPSEVESAGDSSATQTSSQTLYDGLKNPWGMVWLSDGRMLVTERSGEILVFKDDKFTGEKLTGVPEVFAKGQGG